MSDNVEDVGHEGAVIGLIVNDLTPEQRRMLAAAVAVHAEQDEQAIRDAKRSVEAIARDKRIEAIRTRLAELKKFPSYQAAVSSEIGRLTMELSQLQKEGWGQ